MSAAPKAVNGCFLSAVPKAVNGCFLVVVPKRRERMFFIRCAKKARKDAIHSAFDAKNSVIIRLMEKEKRATEKSRADAQLPRCDESGRRLFGKERGAGARG